MAGTGFPMALPFTARTQVRSVFIPRRSNAGSTGLQKPVAASRCSLRAQHFELAARSSFRAIGQLTSRYNQQSARSSRDFHRTWRSDAIQGFTRRILEIRPRPGNATENNEALIVGNRADRIDDLSTGRLLEQPQQDRSDLDPAHPAEATGRLPRDNRIRILQQFRAAAEW